MDPLLRNLSDSTFKQLVQEQRPGWAVPLGQGRPELSPSPSYGTSNISDARSDLQDIEKEEPKTYAGKAWKFLRQMVQQQVLGEHQDIADLRAGKPPGLTSMGKTAAEILDMTPFAVGGKGMGAILVGARAAKNLGGLVEGKFHAGRMALEAGEAPQAVWRQWGVAKTPEGKYVFEPPLQLGESDALRQFAQLYPDVSLKVFRRGGPREGYFDPKTNEIFAQGRTDVDPTDFMSRRRVLEHELQHAADRAEGLSSGTNLKDPNYYNTVGEVRARSVEERLDPTARKWEPSFHEDVDRLKQVIKRHPGAVSEAAFLPRSSKATWWTDPGMIEGEPISYLNFKIRGRPDGYTIWTGKQYDAYLGNGKRIGKNFETDEEAQQAVERFLYGAEHAK